MSVLNRLVRLIYPDRCPYCEAVIKTGDIYCPDCETQMRAVRRPITGGAQGFRCMSSFIYDGKAKRMICSVKFRKRVQFIPQVTVILAEDIRGCYADCVFDLITAVPMFPIDEEARGYNQSVLLAEELSKLMAIPYAPLLRKIKQTKKQHSLRYAERKRNLNGAFEIIDKELIRGKRILMIDDIVTSGNTLGKCCREINKAKPELICCATLANARTVVDEKAMF